MEAGRDYWYNDLMSLPIASAMCYTEPMDAEDPLFILYTSGTTGRPKGIVHTHGGYMVYTYTTLKYVFDIKDEDRYWCAADPGWITGHSYIVYAPLLNGATSFMYEGAPNHPYPNRWWRMVENYGITILYTAPTAIRGLMRFGDAWPNRHDLSSLRLLGSVGEPINPEAWRWYYTVIGKERCPIMDTWWQTETGGFMISPLPITPLKPGSATRPLFGIDVDVVDEEGKPVPAGEEGYLVIKKPWPGMLRTIYNDPERYHEPVLGQVREYVPDRRLGPQGQGRLHLDHRAHGRRDQGQRLPPGHRRGGERPGQPPSRGRSRRHRPAARAQGQCHPRLRHPASRGGEERQAGGGAAQPRGARDRPDRPPRAHHLRGQPAQDAQRQDHAPRC